VLHMDDSSLEIIWYDDGEEAMPVDTKSKSKGPSEGRDTIQSRDEQYKYKSSDFM